MKRGLTGNALKLIAIAAMTLDHVLWVVFPGYQTAWWLLMLHTIGRITAPIMWFFIAEGYLHTHDFKKYALRLLLSFSLPYFLLSFRMLFCHSSAAIPSVFTAPMNRC